MQFVMYRLTSIEEALRTLTDQVGKLVLIEERQGRMYEAQERAFKALSSLDERVKALELAQPITARTNVWVERGLIAVAAAVGAMLLKGFL